MSSIQLTDLVRIESEFYTAPSFNLFNPFYGEEIIDFVQYGTSKELNEESHGFPVLRLNEFDSSFITKPAKYCSKIDQDTFESLKLNKDDVLICRTNGNYKYVGKSAIVPDNYEYAYASYLFKIRPKRKFITSSLLVAYLNSKYGRMEIEKYSMASNQVNFSPAKFRQLRIPRFSIKINSLVESLTYTSYDLLIKSKKLYQDAENLLLYEINMKDFALNRDSINVKYFSKSFGINTRLDAEYYQPKYESYIRIIENYPNGYNSLKNCCEIKLKNFQPYKGEEYRYIELSNIDKTGGVRGCTVDFGENLPSRARRLVKTNDIIISSIEGSLDSCALIPEEFNNSLCSTGFYVINSSELNSATLLVLFKSELMQNILKQNCSGTILTAINKNEFLDIIIPIIKEEAQTQIEVSIKESFSLKKQSKHLLEVAKRAVEIAIEESEEVALKYIEENSSLE